MNFLKCSILLLMLLSCYTVDAQSNLKSYTFKKGEILDILLLTNKPETAALFADYRKVAISVAVKRSYQPQPSYSIEKYTQGNLQPASFLIGKWSSLENREAFIAEIEKEVPKFHELRREIWSLFALTYYEIQEDRAFTVDKDKYNVATAYWSKDKKGFKKFKAEWLQEAEVSGGKLILDLVGGESPLGYYYQPDYLVLMQFENEATFNTFYQENLKMSHQSILHVNQFVLK